MYLDLRHGKAVQRVCLSETFGRCVGVSVHTPCSCPRLHLRMTTFQDKPK